MMKEAEYWIRKLGLSKHPEGGFYRETFRSGNKIEGDALPERYEDEERTFGTVIYYLLRSQDVSHLHRLKSDEFWFHHVGSPITLHTISSDGEYECLHLGRDVSQGQTPQLVIPHTTWFGAIVDEPNSFSLVSCVVAPGFEFEDFEMAQREELLMLCPDHAPIIERLTHD